MMFSFRTACMIFTVVLPAILSASNNSSEEKSNANNLAEVIRFLKDNRDIRCIVGSFALARNEFENAMNATLTPAAFHNTKWPVKIRFDIVHTIHGTMSTPVLSKYYKILRRGHRTNGYYRHRAKDAADPIYKKVAEVAEAARINLSVGIFVQDQNKCAKGVQWENIVRGNGPGAKHELTDDRHDGKGVYIIFRTCSDLDEHSSPFDPRFAGGWVLLYVRCFEDQQCFPLCYSNAKGPLPPAFGRNWTLAQAAPIDDWAQVPRARKVDRACDEQ